LKNGDFLPLGPQVSPERNGAAEVDLVAVVGRRGLVRPGANAIDGVLLDHTSGVARELAEALQRRRAECLRRIEYGGDRGRNRRLPKVVALPEPRVTGQIGVDGFLQLHLESGGLLDQVTAV